MGASETALEQWRRQQQPQEIEVWECNLRTVQLFIACQLSWLAGIGGVSCLGLSMQEIHAALEAHQVPAEERPEVIAGLVLMGRVAARCLNQGR